MNKTNSFFNLQILFLLYFIHTDYCKVYAGDLRKQESKLNTLIEELHSMYKDAFENEKTYITRRFFTKNGNTHYTLHVQKLKEVDGVKTHNLRLEGKGKREDPIIYINNPVEARMPNPFLSIDQFKKVMFERVQKQKKEFDVNKNLLINAKKQFKVFKHLENFHTEMKKKRVKQVIDVTNKIELAKKISTDKLMKTTLHNGSNKVNKKRKQKVQASTTESTDLSDKLIGTVPHKVNKKSKVNGKRKQKVYASSTTESTNLSDAFIETVPHKVNKKRAHTVHVSRGTKSTTIPPKMTITTLPKTIADEAITTETTPDEKITTELTADEDITTEAAADQEINTETIADKKNITKTTADEVINNEKIFDKEITTEMIAKKEIITKPITTTEPTVKTTRTKQLRPYVFVGDK